MDAIRVSQSAFPEFPLEAAVLNDYAVDMRYEPAVLTDVDEEEANAAIAYAQAILDYVRPFADAPAK